MRKTQVVIIGGGVTGAGLLWDLSLRGISAVLLEKKDLANGATGRCHGLLHSGHDTGGLFVHIKGDDPGYVDAWVAGCKQIGIHATELSRDEALALEPNLPPDIVKARTCPDAQIDVFQLTIANVEAAVARGGQYKTYSEVTAIEVEIQKICGVRYRDLNTGEEETIACEIVINAAGGWAQQVAALADVEVPVRCDRGALLIFNHCLTTRVVNRCRKPGDADILVPCGPVSILGTSSVTVPSPENLTVPPEEVQHLLALGAELIPALADARLMRIFTGARPLYVPKTAAGAGGRDISRNFALLDHAKSDNVSGFISIVGGKLTTYRLMAKATADLVCQKLGVNQPCTTDHVPLRQPASEDALTAAHKFLPAAAIEKAHRRLGRKLNLVMATIKANPVLAEIVCECELVSRAELEFVLGDSCSVPAVTIADIGRRTRLGYGPCQGTFCGYKAMLTGYQTQFWSGGKASELLQTYLDDRWKGQAWIPDGKQTEQLDLSQELYSTSYNFHHRDEVITHER
jgi:glycerol-3-phosphate dehydrogenase